MFSDPFRPLRPAPSQLLLSNFSLPVPRIISYNVNSLSYYSTTPELVHRRDLITSCLRDLTSSADIVCLQETNLAATEAFALSSLSAHAVSLNNYKMYQAGTAIIDSPAIMRYYTATDIPLHASLKGFVQLRRYCSRAPPHQSFQLFNVYFKTGQGKASAHLDLVRRMLEADSSVDTFLCGDFNFIEDREDTTGSFTPPTAAFLDIWSQFKVKFSVSEVPHSSFTFFHIPSDPSSYSWASRIDRFFIPSALLSNPLVSADVSLFPHPSNYRPGTATPGARSSFSDHLPIFLSFHDLTTNLPRQSRIPQWVAECPEFAAALTTRWTHPGPDVSPWKVLKKFKAALFAAADSTRRSKIATSNAALHISWHVKLLQLVSRLPQDCPSISLLLSRHSPLAGLVSFKSGTWVDSGLLDATRDLLASTHVASTSPGHNQNVVQQLSSCLPSTRARLASLRLDADSPPVSDEAGKSAIAFSYWSRIWEARSPPSPDTDDGFLDSYTKTVDRGLLSTPGYEDILSSIRSANNSTPGPDGIPFAAWRAVPDLSAKVLSGVLDALVRGLTPPSGFNHGFLFLLPKKDTGLVSDTRPISVTNTDNRILAKTVARAIMPAVTALLDPAQRGFLAGISGHPHIEDINKFFFQGVVDNSQRFVFLLDTAKAFDSIDHAWIFKVLRKAAFPNWFLHFVKCSLHDVKVGPFFGGPPSCLIPILRGVKQGCPLSPLLFIISYDPLLSNIRAVTAGPTPPLSPIVAPEASLPSRPFYPPVGPLFHFSRGSALFESPLIETPCQGLGPSGLPCPLVTLFHAPYCMSHAVSILGLTVKPSPIPDAGLGLFATREFAPGSHLTSYLGEILSKEQLEARYGDDSFTAPYAVSVSTNIFIDAACFRGIGAYANGARNGLRSNARFCVHPASRSARLVATRRIRSGDEIIAAYGPGYWRGSGSFSTDPAPSWEWSTFPATRLLPVPVGEPPSLGPSSRSAPVQIYAFADDLALTTEAILSLFPALRLIDSFAVVSGLGINKVKSCVICSLGPSSYAEVVDSLHSGPWPDLPLKPDAVHLGIPIGREITLGDIYAKPLDKALKRLAAHRNVVRPLSLSNRITYVNTFIVSIFSYHMLFFLLPSEFYNQLVTAIRRLVIPFNGAGLTYGTLVCAGSLWHVRPALKDPWAFNVSLLAVRSPYLQTTVNYNSLPHVRVKHSRFISDHRDAAAIDFWLGRHLPDGTLTPLSSATSPAVYKAIVFDTFHDKAFSHSSLKVASFLNPPPAPPPPEYPGPNPVDAADGLSLISSSLKQCKHSPSSLIFHHVALIHNALPTLRRMRHQNKIALVDVPACFFCAADQDSISHIYGPCGVVTEARMQFLTRHNLLAPSPFSLGHSFLSLPRDTPLSTPYVAAILSFNLAVWRFRGPVRSTVPERDHAWRVARVAELAETIFNRALATRRKAPTPAVNAVAAHDTDLRSLDPTTAVCYTDGSASPNPGPTGAGAVLFLPGVSGGLRIDLGASLGHGTNNLGEIFAIGICLQVLLQCFSVHHFPNAVLFTDSKYALQVLSSRSSPTSNFHAVSAVRALLLRCSRFFNVSLRWLKGHAGIPGNSIADLIAGHYSPVRPTVQPPGPAVHCGISFDMTSFMPTPVSAFCAFSSFNGSLSTVAPSVDFSSFVHIPLGSIPAHPVPAGLLAATIVLEAPHRLRGKLNNARALSPPRRSTRTRRLASTLAAEPLPADYVYDLPADYG
jgi:ribonuclease HI/exonuclease III